MLKNDNDKTIRYFCAECHKIYSISRQDMFALNEYSFTFGSSKVKEFINKVTKSKFTKFDDIIRVHYCPICHKYASSFGRPYDDAYRDYQRVVKRIIEENIDFENYYDQAEKYYIDGEPYVNAIVRIKQKKEEPSVFDKDIDVNNEAGYNALLKATADTLKGVTGDKKEDDDMVDIVTNDNKSVSIFIKISDNVVDIAKLRKLIYIDEFTGISTECKISDISIKENCLIIHVHIGVNKDTKSIKIYTGDTNVSLVSEDAISITVNHS